MIPAATTASHHEEEEEEERELRSSSPRRGGHPDPVSSIPRGAHHRLTRQPRSATGAARASPSPSRRVAIPVAVGRGGAGGVVESTARSASHTTGQSPLSSSPPPHVRQRRRRHNDDNGDDNAAAVAAIESRWGQGWGSVSFGGPSFFTPFLSLTGIQLWAHICAHLNLELRD